MTLTFSELSEAMAVADKMLELAGKATEAPWHHTLYDARYTDNPEATVWGPAGPGYGPVATSTSALYDRHRRADDAAFIAASRTAVPLLANAVKALADGGAQQQPVAWRVKDFADGWILCWSKERADEMAHDYGALVEPLFSRPPLPSQPIPEREKEVQELIDEATNAIPVIRATYTKGLVMRLVDALRGDHLKPTGGA